MKKKMIAAAIMAAGVTGVALAPTASASSQGYLLCVKASFAPEDVPTAEALSIGQNIERLLDYNQPPEAIVNRMSHGTGFTPTEVQAIIGCVQRNKPL